MSILYLDSFEGYADTIETGERSMAFGNNSGSVSYISRTGQRAFGPTGVNGLPSSNPDNLFLYNANPKMRLPPFTITTSLGIAGAFYLTNKHTTNSHGPLLTINVDGLNGASIDNFRASVFVDSGYQLWVGTAGRTNFGGGGWAEVAPIYKNIPALKWSHLAIYVYSAINTIGQSSQNESMPDGTVERVYYSGIWDISLDVIVWLNGVQVFEHVFIIGYHHTNGVSREHESQLRTFINSEDIGTYYTNQFNMGFAADDIYIFTEPSDVVDLPIDIIRPNGASVTNWLPSDPFKANWELVNDASSDEDVSVVTSTFASQLDMYQFEDTNLGLDSEIIAVQLTQVVKKTSNTVASTCAVWDPGGTGTRYYDVPITLHDGSHVYFQTVQMVNPVTGNPWTVQELDDILAGVSRVR